MPFNRALIVLLALATVVRAETSVASPFGDHAVLQRDLPIPVWGVDSPGTRVEVTLDGSTAVAIADATGRWRVDLPAHPAGGPYALTIAGTSTLLLRDVLVGEVWLCSGQSNMEWAVAKANRGAEEVAAAGDPRIRLLNLNPKRRPSETPQDAVNAAWQPCTPETIGAFSAVGYFFGRELVRELQVPIGLISSSYGGTGAESWTSRGALASQAEFTGVFADWEDILARHPAKMEEYRTVTLPQWEQDAARAKADGRPVPRKPREPRGPGTPQHRPAALYNGMIAPLTPYGLRGVVWYQGEENATSPIRAEAYRRLLPLMIGDWRSAFGRDVSFHLVQLANFGVNKPVEGHWPVINWPILRESQALVADSVPGCGMAVAIDIGDPADIHPTNKQEVGRRLALVALAKDYGRAVRCSGPMFAGMTVEGSTAVVSFSHAEGLAARDGRPLGFQLAGDDGIFRAALATIAGATVQVTAEGVPAPIAVRYAWANSPDGNLINAAGLPAMPFRHPQR